MTRRRESVEASTGGRTVRAYRSEQLQGNILFQAVVLFLAAAITTSRAADGGLSGAALAAIAAGAAFTSGTMGWIAGLYEGAHHRLDGTVVIADARDRGPAFGDVFEASALWRRALTWGGMGLVWAGAGGVLAGAVLDGRAAPLGVVVAALVLLVGVIAVSVNLAARTTGIATVTARCSAPPRPVHRRSWLELALPVAALQLAFNAGAAWVLFHDYSVGDPLADRVLTRGDALADVGVVVALLTAALGLMAARWGRVDAAVGRVTVDQRLRSGITAKAPLGVQGLVYVAMAALVVGRVAGWFLPALPGLARVVIVRGVFAGVLAFVVVGVAYARGAVNTAVGASPLARPIQAEGRPTGRRRRSADGARPDPAIMVTTAAVVVGLALAPAFVPRRAAADADPVIPLDQRDLAAEAETFGLRVEYDIPVPAGTGSVPRAATRIGVPSDQNAWGLGAAPTHFDPVVGGAYFDPVKDDDPTEDGQQTNELADRNRLPVAECFHPGTTVDTSFSFPADTRAEMADLPSLGYASARCSEGPEVEVHARVGAVGDLGTASEGAGPVVTAAAGAADALARPVEGVLRAEASGRLTDVSFLGGVLTIDAVETTGASSVTGRSGDQATEARVDLVGVEAGGTRFSLRGDALEVAGNLVPLASPEARQVVGEMNAALAPAGCEATLIGPTDRYPQGFLLSRKSPEVGTVDDGTFAASMAGGLLVLCDVPEEISGNSEFNPQRVQFLVGFVFTSASAREEVGGFGLGNLASNPTAGLLERVEVKGATAVADIPPPLAAVREPARSPEVASPAAPSKPHGAPLPAVLTVPGAGWLGEPWAWSLAALAWIVTTHLGIRRLRALLGLTHD